jgi:hypothetical protein
MMQYTRSPVRNKQAVESRSRKQISPNECVGIRVCDVKIREFRTDLHLARILGLRNCSPSVVWPSLLSLDNGMDQGVEALSETRCSPCK